MIPTLNEAPGIVSLLQALRDQSPRPEIIVVDGGSDDETVKLAEPLADRVLISESGRGQQLNAGAQAATGDILWFVHADSQIPPGAAQLILNAAAASPDLAGGAFRLQFNQTSAALRLIAFGANLRSRLFGQPWGDQGIFVPRSRFEQVGRFPDWPILEDLELMRRLRKIGRIKILKQPIITSARRYQKLGLLKTVMINFRILWQLYRGRPIEEIQHRFRPLASQGGGANK